MDLKFCNKCKKEKPTSNFSKNKVRKDGLSYYCKSCMCKYHRKYMSNPEYRNRRNRYISKYRKNNKEKVNEYRRNYCKKNRKIQRKQTKERYRNHKILSIISPMFAFRAVNYCSCILLLTHNS